MNAFQAVGDGHLGFFNFDALLDIFELGIQQIWIQHNKSKKLVCQKLTRFASRTLNMHIFRNSA